MPKKITKLTPEQISQFKPWVKKWIEIGLSTEPADFDAAIEAALKAYKLANLGKPMVILQMGSPYSATIGGYYAWSFLNSMKSKAVKAQVWSQVWSQVRDQVMDQVRSQVMAQVMAQVGDQVRNQVRNQVGDQVRNQVEDQVMDQVMAQVGDQVRNQVEDQFKNAINNSYGGQLWNSGWDSFVTFFRDVCDWKTPILERAEINEQLTRSCGWVWWHENVLSISDRPEFINRDDQGRLHCENGPAMQYRDGWSLWNWHGTSVPKEWIIDKSSISAKDALTWKNIEQRRAACEIVGWARILKELDAKTINIDSPQIGTLVEVSFPDAGRERFLRVMCGTGREFAIPVPKEIKTAMQANLWTYGIDKVDASMLPEIRT